MAEDIKDKEDSGTEKMVGVKLLKALGDNSEGEVILVPESVADALVGEGCAEHATADDINGGDEVETPEEDIAEQPMVANAVNRLAKRVEKAVSSSVAQIAGKIAKPTTPGIPTMPAQQKAAPALKTVGAMVASVLKAMKAKKVGDDATFTREQNKVQEYQQKAADAWSEKLGYVVKSPLGINEGTTTQGGFLVNPEFSPDVYTIPHEQLDLLALCEQRDAKSNVFNQRFVNETSLANGSIYGGLNMVATAEGASFTSSLPAWSNIAFTLQKEALFLYYTSEILEDASYPIESEVNEYILKAFLYGLNSQVIQGSTLEGILNTPALVTVTSSANDTAFHTTPSTSLTYADLANMWASVYNQSSPGGVWLFHPSLAVALVQMTYTFSGNAPAWGIQYNAETGLKGATPTTPYSIFGRPAFPHYSCSAPGSAGDILYVDFGSLLHYRRPYRVEVSKEYAFNTDQIAVRAIRRLDAKARMRNKVTGPTGAQQFSQYVTRSSAGT